MSILFSTILRKQSLVNLLVTCLLSAGFSLCRGTAQALPDDMHSWALAGIEYIHNEKFKQAEDEAKKIIKKYPGHPAGYFFLAAAIDAWSAYYQSSKREEDFYRCCDKAIETGERWLEKDPENAWVKFFYGGADGYKGTYESRYERWITAFRHGWKGVSTLADIAKSNPELHDVNYGLGTYNYWRSAMTKMLWWMPGVANKSETGIAQLTDARNFGVYTKISAAMNLMYVFCNERRFEKALAICEELLPSYPTNMNIYWGKGQALFGLERFDEAEKIYQYLLSRVEAEPMDNHYNAVLCHFWLAKIFYATKRYTQCIAECNRMQYYKLDEDIKKRLEKFFVEANSIKSESEAASLKKQEAEFIPSGQ